ncbi:MAG: hypothetical protein JXR68_03135 [Bacteroidales bacterium]|nr:hypothetical protein [Bacteroidales bacterium]
MKQDHIFNFLWWLATPFFIVFFFLILLLFTAGITYINSFLYLTIFLVTIPLFVDWVVAMFFPKKEELRPKISALVFLTDFILTYFLIAKDFSPIIKFFYAVFAIQIIISFILRFLKQNQYTFLLGAFFATTVTLSVLMVYDFYYLIIIELLFAGIIIKYFIKFKIDTTKKMMTNYLLGVFSTTATALTLFYLVIL